jgi:DNA (cytosine-5)-methyltransferase 1
MYQESEYGVQAYETPGTLREGRIPEHQMIAAPLTKGSATGEGVNAPGRRQEDDVNIVVMPAGVAESHSRAADHGDVGVVSDPPQVAPPLVSRSSRGHAQGNSPGHNADAVVAFSWQQGDDSKFTGTGRGRSWVARAGDYAAGLSASGRHDAISGEAVGVRRLTPTECERLQGFPDGWTQLGDTPDSRRYSALGDAVTVNVSEWIGRRLAA